MARQIRSLPVRRATADGMGPPDSDTVVVEEPLEVRVGGRVVLTTLRTPGHDVELAHGWLLAEGVIGKPSDVRTARFCPGRAEDGTNSLNVLDVELAPWVQPPEPRLTTATASCGVCGSATLDTLLDTVRSAATIDGTTIPAAALVTLPAALRARQPTFDRTGGTHAAGLATPDGTVVQVREDVGRHNAVDKLLGWALMRRHTPLRGRVLVLSGRAGFELVQKAAAGGLRIVVSVGAPTTLAIEAARRGDVTLVGFTRQERAVVYTSPERITDV